MTKMVNFQ
ncbi:hypothetical protein CGLO_18156 [Colletotrichum gloeosporioides Cg-14]|uniref:Uncharacterized protein n=1 Tax=Colletotrichum gloeosporioides (strain Cg-14) TaxID=1237896 RepID=T0KV66_COLGC|nr:hypothetical protein CGLO_18156 [Colletotrichum gloeosporioides Cg-14]